MRSVRPCEWLEVDSRDVHDLYHKHFWHPQLAWSPAARDYLVWWAETQGGAGGPQGTSFFLAQEDIDYVLGEEQGETLILKRHYDIHLQAKWYIKIGKYVTLAELFNYGKEACSCHSLYQLYLRQPIFVHKRPHSESRAEGAVANRNARQLRHAETGHWGLPDQPW